MGIDPNDPNTKTTTNVVINTNPSLEELKEQAVKYGIPLGPPGNQRIITPEEYAQQKAAAASSSKKKTLPASSSTTTTTSAAPAAVPAPVPVKRGRPRKTAASTAAAVTK